MKKAARVIGIILMVFNGIGIFALLANLISLIKEIGFFTAFMMLALFGALFYLSYRLYSAGTRGKKEKSPVRKNRKNAQTAVHEEQTVREEPLKQTETTPALKPQTAVQAAAAQEPPEAKTEPESRESLPSAPFYTVIAYDLDLPFHDGDSFFLFKNEADARHFVQISGRKDLSVRSLNDDILKRELAEYLSCGYTGAIIKNNLSVNVVSREDRHLSSDELIRDFQLPMASVGSTLPTAGKKMHLYLNQLSYTKRKYGPDLSAVPESWKNHLKTMKDEAIRHLLCANLCLKSSQGSEGRMTISVLTATMPSGEKYAALFTDMFAIYRYTHQPPDSVVLPNLLSDVARDIREGRIKETAGIMINPGREELKLTVEEIAEQEAWLDAHPDLRGMYTEKNRGSSVNRSEEEPVQRQEEKSEAPNASRAESGGGEPALTAETPGKIDLGENMEKASVTPGRSFFMGLLPGEKPYSEKEVVAADENRPDTEGFTKVTRVGFASRWSEYYYDPKYRRFVIDHYTANPKTGDRQYHGRSTILPLDLIDQFNQYPEDRNPIKIAQIERIQKLMRDEHFGE